MLKALGALSLGALISFVGRVLICSGTAAGGWALLASLYDNQITSPILLICVFVFVGYLIGGLVMSLFSTSVATILQCYFIDAEVNGNAKFAPNTLSAFIVSK